ncbi:hypothetical protein BJ508DRAFT_416695 [Ascobolus immersus RN42]|uniref:Uncharacterized protein n=1 Tax=Ascobolus immersus RN42 TaxID=1160509 RepID=A0A3N4HY08_ASCIM|nr:hypothetical protein BJ508DRAFT_416695 [Ascobolus immersus RN42]
MSVRMVILFHGVFYYRVDTVHGAINLFEQYQHPLMPLGSDGMSYKSEGRWGLDKWTLLYPLQAGAPCPCQTTDCKIEADLFLPRTTTWYFPVGVDGLFRAMDRSRRGLIPAWLVLRHNVPLSPARLKDGILSNMFAEISEITIEDKFQLPSLKFAARKWIGFRRLDYDVTPIALRKKLHGCFYAIVLLLRLVISERKVFIPIDKRKTIRTDGGVDFYQFPACKEGACHVPLLAIMEGTLKRIENGITEEILCCSLYRSQPQGGPAVGRSFIHFKIKHIFTKPFEILKSDINRKRFLEESRMVRPKKAWLLYTVAQQLYDWLRTVYEPLVRRALVLMCTPYPAAGACHEPAVWKAYREFREESKRGTELAELLVFIWKLRAPSVEWALVRHCPAAAGIWYDREGSDNDGNREDVGTDEV